MDAEDALPRRGPASLAAALSHEDLDPCSVAELDERIILLEAEIARTKARRKQAVNHKARADALFQKRP